MNSRLNFNPGLEQKPFYYISIGRYCTNPALEDNGDNSLFHSQLLMLYKTDLSFLLMHVTNALFLFLFQDHEARLQDIQEERQRRRGEQQAKETAACVRCLHVKLYLRNRKYFLCFHRVLEIRVEVRENGKSHLDSLLSPTSFSFVFL